MENRRFGRTATYRSADKSLARPGRKQAPKHVRDARDFTNIETLAVIKHFFLQGKAPKEIHTILTETLACFLPGRAKDLSAPLYIFTVILRTFKEHIKFSPPWNLTVFHTYKSLFFSCWNCNASCFSFWFPELWGPQWLFLVKILTFLLAKHTLTWVKFIVLLYDFVHEVNRPRNHNLLFV